MTFPELIVFISTVCNLDISALPFSYKQQCIDHYNNCLIGSGGEILDRKINVCLERAKAEKYKWQ